MPSSHVIDTGEAVTLLFSKGKIPRCASVRYSYASEGELPASLRGKEREEAYKDEWKALRKYGVIFYFNHIRQPCFTVIRHRKR